MGKRRELVSEEDYRAALARGREAMREPHAIGARFDAATRSIAIDFSNGFVCAFRADDAPALRGRLGDDLSDVAATAGGDGLVFEKADLAVSLPALLASMLPPAVGRAWAASTQGRKTSPAKAAAARANGALGGRPRKRAAARR